MNKVPKLAIFDCDGIITETAHLHYYAWKKIAKDSLDIELDEQYLNEFRGLSRIDSLNLILKNLKSDKKLSDSDKNKIIDKKNKFYQELIEKKENVVLLPGIVEFIKTLRSNGIKIAMASTSRNSKHLLKLHEIDNLFDYIVDPDEIKNHKPAPDIFLKAAEHFQIDVKDCWGIEDAFVGIASIKAAKIWAIGVGELKNIGNADVILSSTADLDYQKLLIEFQK